MPLLAAIADVIAVVIVIAGSRDRRVARAFVSMGTCLAAWNALIGLRCIPGFMEQHGTVIFILAHSSFLLPSTLFHNAVVWSGDHGARMRRAILAAYASGLILSILYEKGFVVAGTVSQSWGHIGAPGRVFPAFIAHVVGWTGAGCLVCAKALRDTSSPANRLLTKYWILGNSVAFPLALTNLLASYLPVFPLGSIGTMFAVGAVGYAAVRHQLMDIDAFVMRTAATLLASVAVVVPLAAAVIWAQHLPVGVSSSLVLGCLLLSALLSLLLFSRFRSYLEAQVESSLFPTRRAARDAIRMLSADLVRLAQREDICNRVATTLLDGLGLDGVALYLSRSQPQTFKLVCSCGTLDAPARIDRSGVPSKSVGAAPDALSPGKFEGTGGSTAWSTFVPVQANGEVMGLIAVGRKLSGAAFDESDITLLSVVAAQLAIALKNSEYVREISRQRGEIQDLHKRVAAENVVLRAEVRSVSQFNDIIGSSTALQRVLAMVERVAPTDASILITGETGTGKELIARAIHELSPRRAGPLITVNCPAIPTGLAESELFGHERGAFTSAVEARPGKFELAHGGTIFLDEIADLSLELQVKLLRVLQEHESQRIGGRKVYKLDLRVVAATNRDLHAEIRAQRFREDLYFRLAAVPVEVPPLRERAEDIPMLASFFLDRAATTYQKAIRGLTPEALAALCRYSWPGNIRELQHVIERAALLCNGDVIQPEHLSDLADLAAQAPQPEALRAALRNEKLRRVEQALAQSGGNQAAAARLLGLSRSNFSRLLKNLGLRSAVAVQ